VQSTLRRIVSALEGFVSRRPWAVVALWVALAAVVILCAPDLTQVAAEREAQLLPADASSTEAARRYRAAWPDSWYESKVVVALERPGGLTEPDHAYARRLEHAFDMASDRPQGMMRVLGPGGTPELARRLFSRDGTLQLLVVQLSDTYVSPSAGRVVDWLMNVQANQPPPPEGLEVLWTGDAVIGRDYMAGVRRTLDRAAVVTVVLLFFVLWGVYRSLILAMVPLATIGTAVLVARGVLAWLARAGWELSPLAELFLVVVLFGCGTDFCLFLSWRFAEEWDADDPAAAMRATLRRASGALLTSAGTVIVGLSMLRLTRFSLFSSTGPTVALGLALTLIAALTLTPALLILVARWRPAVFAGWTSLSPGFWDRLAHLTLRRPVRVWASTLALLLVPALLASADARPFTLDVPGELPGTTPSIQAMQEIAPARSGARLDLPSNAGRFWAGELSPMTVVLTSGPEDFWRDSSAIALIDDLSRMLERNGSFVEVRSATQPLGSARTFEPARLGSRLEAVREGFGQIAGGARELESGLYAGVVRLRAAGWIESLTGVSLMGNGPNGPRARRDPGPDPAAGARSDAGPSLLARAAGALLGSRPMQDQPGADEDVRRPGGGEKTPSEAEQPQEAMAAELSRGAAAARQIAQGAQDARVELDAILQSPVGRRALQPLLITPETIRQHPEIERSLAAYISPEGRTTRLELVQSPRLFSTPALEQVDAVDRFLREALPRAEDENGAAATSRIAVAVGGPNAMSRDVLRLTEHDQRLIWVLVPLGVFLVLWVTLRDVGACVNLVATMVLTYAFALGVTHLVFVVLLGHAGIDWKVPYFLFVLLVAVGVDYNVFLMTRMHEEIAASCVRAGIVASVGRTGGLITSAAAITACSFASFLTSPLSSIRELGFALVVGILTDAAVVRPILVPCGQWLLNRSRGDRPPGPPRPPAVTPNDDPRASLAATAP
jgi:RND superfamily putative drug exporter